MKAPSNGGFFFFGMVCDNYSSMENTSTITVKKIKLQSGKEIELNDQQVRALDMMTRWITSDSLFFTLSGYAGTGKTTLTLELIKIYQNTKRNSKSFYDNKSSVTVSAPTHKARKVIEMSSGKRGFTIQKLLGLRPNTDLENFDINKPQFDERARKEIGDHGLVIIDEASMLNKGLFKLILREATNYGTKVLFMGDAAQLPPVGEALSHIFTNVEDTVELTKVERQKDGNPLMMIYDAIRENVASAGDQFPHTTNVNDKNEGIEFFDDIQKFDDIILKMFVSEPFLKNPDYIKMISWTNASVKSWNKKIRNHIFSGCEEPVVVGDLLLGYNTVMENNESILIENSSDYKVESVNVSKSGMNIIVYKVGLVAMENGRQTMINIVHKDGMERFGQEFHLLHNAAVRAVGKERGGRWREYYMFKEKHLLIEDVMEGGKLLVKKDIDYGYAITVHKCQGSSFVHVAVSERNLNTNRDHKERNKLKYVAFSRPTTKALVYTDVVN